MSHTPEARSTSRLSPRRRTGPASSEALRIEELGDMLSPDDGQLSTMNGMLANGSHPRAIANKILADRT